MPLDNQYENSLYNLEKIKSQLNGIIDNKQISPVFQPIISLKDTSILGYEALSRITDQKCDIKIDNIFYFADILGRSWQLEELCRNKSLEAAGQFGLEDKLFINVNPNIINDNTFESGFTQKRLKQYHLNPDNIVFEITERVAISDLETFKRSIEYYKNQKYQIAIDDIGSGYAGLNMICDVKPDYLKIDMNIIRGIQNDDLKKSLVKSLVEFSNRSNIKLIAEGIEKAEELTTVIRLGVEYGQGYFIQVPSKDIKKIRREALEKIIEFNAVKNRYLYNFINHKLADLCKRGISVLPETPALTILESIEKNPDITEITVIDEKDNPIGLITKAKFLEAFAGRYGFVLNQKKKIHQLMDMDYLKVDGQMAVDVVSRLAMARTEDKLYDPIIVTKKERYLGVATIKDLLETTTSMEVFKAKHSNPLTGLPGNLIIEDHILKCINSTDSYGIIYIDIDNFKPYNDAYGFENGDIMLRILAEILIYCCNNNEFVGHIGGDDFIIITEYTEVEYLCQKIVTNFNNSIHTLYNANDLKNGYIISQNRNGKKERFPLASLSIAGITNKEVTFKQLDEFSKAVASVKKLCKNKTGNCILIS